MYMFCSPQVDILLFSFTSCRSIFSTLVLSIDEFINVVLNLILLIFAHFFADNFAQSFFLTTVSNPPRFDPPPMDGSRDELS